MPTILTCPWGHRWEYTGDAKPGNIVPCPKCGDFPAVPNPRQAPSATEPAAAPPPPGEPSPFPIKWIFASIVAALIVLAGGYYVMRVMQGPAAKTPAGTTDRRDVVETAPALPPGATQPASQPNAIAANATRPPEPPPQLAATAPDTEPASAPATGPKPQPVDTPGAIRIATLVLDAARVDGGTPIRVTYTLRNAMVYPLSVPLREGDYMMGRRTHAVQRLGDDARIKGLERNNELVGKRYVLSSRLTVADPVIAPGETFRYNFDLPTDGLDAGSYRCWVTFKSLEGEGPGEERSIDFEVVRAAPPVVATAPARDPGFERKPKSEIETAWENSILDTLDEKARTRDLVILQTMRRGVDRLLTSEPNWLRTDAGFPGGYAALNTYALLHVGHAIPDPRLRYSSADLKEPIDLLLQLDSNFTYVAALQASALAMLPARKEFIEPLKRVQKNLLVKTGGAYSYRLETASRVPPDNSNGQYANLGVWATQDAGLEVPNDYWPTAEKRWRGIQCADGGWDYNTNGRGHSTFTMTSAALASLLTASASQLSDKSPYRDPQIVNGFKQLEKLFVAERGIFGARDGYGLYGMERVGLASGFKRFGNYDWYDEGAASVVNRQKTGAYELLFLTRGRNPVVLNKLKYDGPWDARPWDAAILTRWLAKASEQELNWQIVTADSPVEDWMDSPLLLITGERSFFASPALVTKLQAYIDAGGTVLSTSDKANPEFTTFIRSLANRVCRGRYELRDLPADHMLAKFSYPLRNPLQLMGMSNGVREVWLHSPVDLGIDWQRYAIASEDSFSIPANVVFYINNKAALRRRVLLVDPTRIKPPAAGQEVTVAQLEYPANWQPEPGVWPLFTLWAGTKDLKVTSTSTTPERLRVSPPKVLYLTGTARFSPTDAMRTSIAAYVNGGGTLFADAAGGRGDFAESFALLLKQAFPNQQLVPIEQTDELYPQLPAETQLYRRSWILENGNSSQFRLKGIKINGRWAVIYSPDDIATGFLGIHTWGIQGYNPEVARDLAANILRYAAKIKPAAP